MKVFLSWSGNTSRAVAQILHGWLLLVIHELQPFMSSEDIEKGSRGLEVMARQLEATSFGIVVVTEDNHSRPWINFEAGALSKAVSTGRVVPLLFRVSETQIVGPLTQFQFVKPERDPIHALMRGLNSAAGTPLREAMLDRVFDKWWPDLQRDLNGVAATKTEQRERAPSDMLEELLRLVRAQQRSIDHIRASPTGAPTGSSTAEPLSRMAIIYTGSHPDRRTAFIPMMKNLSANRGLLGVADEDSAGYPRWTLVNVERELRKVLAVDVAEEFGYDDKVTYEIDAPEYRE